MNLLKFLTGAALLGTGLVAPTWSQVPQDDVVESIDAARFSTKTSGNSAGTLDPARDWVFGSNGYLESVVAIPNDDPASRATGSPHTFIITAYGVPAGNVWPVMNVLINGMTVQRFTVGTTTPAVYTFTASVRAGMRRVRLTFVNPANLAGTTRKLSVRNLTIKSADITANLPAGAGTFAMQSVSVLGGFFWNSSLNTDGFGTSLPCTDRPGCQNIDFVKGIGGNDVTLTSVCTIAAGSSKCAPQINGNTAEAELRNAIRHARSRGLGVTLKPFVLAPSPIGHTVLATAQWVPANPADFFDSVEANLIRHARIAREEGVGLMMLGAEMGGALTASQTLNGQCSRWTQLIANVKAAAAAVVALPVNSPAVLKLTYSPTLAGFWNDLGANEGPYVCFWDKLDYIGLNAYPNMNHPTVTSASPPAARLVTGWNVYKRLFNAENIGGTNDDMDVLAPAPNHNYNALLANSAFDIATRTDTNSYRSRYATSRYSTKWYVDYVIDGINERFKASLQAQGKYPLKAILTEVGASSSYTVQGYWGAAPDASAYAPSLALYVDEQARGWDGYLRAFRGDPRIVGISIWGLRPYHGRNWTTGLPPDWLSDFDFNGKVNASGQRVTEEQVCRWFKRGYAAVSPCYAQP